MPQARSHIFAILLGIFCLALAAIAALSPLLPVYRSLSILLIAFIAVSFSGFPFGYIIVLITPLLGLYNGGNDWLIMLPLVLSSGLLAMLAMDYGGRWLGWLLSPLLCVAPIFVVWQAAQHELFNLELPWVLPQRSWVMGHGLVALLGALIITLIPVLNRSAQRDV